MPFQGSFKNFTANIDFDPDHPETGKIAATIDIASASTGDGERDGMLPQSSWFDTGKFPQAQFHQQHDQQNGARYFHSQRHADD